MGQPHTAEYWHPTRRGYFNSLAKFVEKMRDSVPPTPEEVEEIPGRNGWAQQVLGKVLTSEKFRLSRKEAYEKYWSDVRRTKHDSTSAQVRLKAHDFPGSRAEIFEDLCTHAFNRPIRVAFTDGSLDFPPGAWIGDLQTLADITGYHPDTIRVALDDLQRAGVLHHSSTWDGTIIQIVGYYVNRPSKPYARVRTDYAAVQASLRVAPSEGKPSEPPPPLSPEVKARIDELKRTGRWPGWKDPAPPTTRQ